VLIEILILFALILLNGVLAMSELAVVSSRTARLQVMADEGSRGAALAIELAAAPGRFLSSVQIGITLVGVLSGAVSGATLGVRLAGALEALGLGAGPARTLGVGGVVVAITYLSLVFGELVPKRIALRMPEAAAARIAPLLRAISVGAAPAVWLLDRSGALVLALLGQSGPAERGVTDEEVKIVLSEARTAGVMEPAETEMIAGVMRIADRTAKGLMVPRHEVETVDISDPPEAILRRFSETGHSRLPVREGDDDAIVGVFKSRDFVAGIEGRDLRSLLVDAPAVRDGMAALDVLEALRKAPAHLVLVYDEFGHFEGIVTPMDVLEAIAGEFPDAAGAEAKFEVREDGSLLVAGWTPVDEFAERTGIALAPDRDYATVAGLVLALRGTLPRAGESVEVGGWRLEVVDLDGRRIDKVLAEPLETGPRPSG